MAQITKKQLSKIARNKREIRQSMFPKLNEAMLWDRKNTDGWLSVPRAMPLILRIMDMIAPKGKPVSQTYLDLWCRTYDDSFVIVKSPREAAFYSGFTGERAERTWGSRISMLVDLGFILTEPGVSGKYNYIIVHNPYLVIEHHKKNGLVPAAAYNALRDRMAHIGANDLIVKKTTEKKRLLEK